MDTAVAFALASLLTAVFVLRYQKAAAAREHRARRASERGKASSEGPRCQHPHIDTSRCIGCGGCTSVCPEGEVLALLGGKAAIVGGHRCIGHGLCADACPVGAIEMTMASPGMAADLPFLTRENETNLPNLFIAGELGGLALIKNAVNQGRDCIDIIAARRTAPRAEAGPLDVVIVGAGPAGISATLRAIERGLRYVTLERDEIGGTVSKYPRQKLVMTSPVELPLYGRFRKTELSKEELLAIWRRLLAREDVSIRTGEPVQSIEGRDGLFEVVTERSAYRARAVVLALGRAGTPRKLGIPGEELPKVMYRLIEADHYTGKRLLVVGGGDSAVEAAMGLASQPGNDVTLSYRQDRFSRIKERNAHRLEACRRAGKLRVLLRSHPVCFTPDAAILEVDGARQELPNDFAWIFAGGVPPNGFLKAIGVAFGARDLTVEAGREAREAAGARAAARQAVTRASEDPSAAATSSSRTGLKSS